MQFMAYIVQGRGAGSLSIRSLQLYGLSFCNAIRPWALQGMKATQGSNSCLIRA